MRPQIGEPSVLALGAALATVFGLAVAPVAMVPILMLAAAVTFAGLRAVALAAVVVLTLIGVAGLRIDASARYSDSKPGERR